MDACSSAMLRVALPDYLCNAFVDRVEWEKGVKVMFCDKVNEPSNLCYLKASRSRTVRDCLII
eukprot:scaffold200227_cov20-Prasinocladus_malaysianus.AAC.1